MARLLILGAGFAGLWAAIGAARKLDELGEAAEILVVDRNPYHNIRVRNYEVDLNDTALPLGELLDPIGVHHSTGEVCSIDPVGQKVTIRTDAGSEIIGYDRAVLTLGSELVRPAIPGLASHSFDVDTYAAASQRTSCGIEQARTLAGMLDGSGRWRGFYRNRSGDRNAR